MTGPCEYFVLVTLSPCVHTQLEGRRGVGSAIKLGRRSNRFGKWLACSCHDWSSTGPKILNFLYFSIVDQSNLCVGKIIQMSSTFHLFELLLGVSAILFPEGHRLSVKLNWSVFHRQLFSVLPEVSSCHCSWDIILPLPLIPQAHFLQLAGLSLRGFCTGFLSCSLTTCTQSFLKDFQSFLNPISSFLFVSPQIAS